MFPTGQTYLEARRQGDLVDTQRSASWDTNNEEGQRMDSEGQMEKNQHSIYHPENDLHGNQKQIIVAL